MADASFRILVVDDCADAADSLAMLLRLRGHEVRTVYAGAEALRLAWSFLPEVVLLDIGMPKLDGYAVARALRSAPALRATRIVAVTGYGREQDRRRAFASGCDGHLVKPYGLEELERAIRPADSPSPGRPGKGEGPPLWGAVHLDGRTREAVSRSRWLVRQSLAEIRQLHDIARRSWIRTGNAPGLPPAGLPPSSP